MHHDYPDLRALTPNRPLWWDSHGTPRYAPFAPGLCPSIYAREVALVDIACQACGERFQVEMHLGRYVSHGGDWTTLAQRITADTLHYGDPPFHPQAGQCSGTTMNCDDLRVVEYWRRDAGTWERKSEFEMQLERGEGLDG